MGNRANTRREGTRVIEAYRRVLWGGGFPNPERTGCPGDKLLQAMASREVGIEQANDWIEHLGTCSPCFREYTELRKRAQWRITATFIGMAAAVIFVILAVGLWRRHAARQEVMTVHHHIIADMRTLIVPRGDQSTSKGTLVFEQGFDEVTFYLPEGSRTGTYEFAVFPEQLTEPLATGAAIAKVENGTTGVNVTLNLSRIAPGFYVLGSRLVGTDWSYHPLIIR